MIVSTLYMYCKVPFSATFIGIFTVCIIGAEVFHDVFLKPAWPTFYCFKPTTNENQM